MKLNAFDRVLGYFAPAKALQNAVNRQRLNFYEAGTQSKDRKWRTDRGSGDSAVLKAGDSLRIQARHLEQNHDLAKGILDTLVNNTIGQGVRYEPQVRRLNGELHDEFNQELTEWFDRWSDYPDVTRTMCRSEMERLYCRTWFRDGEAFKTYHTGNIRSLKHPTSVLLAIDAMEADLVPIHLNDKGKNIVQGIKKDSWGQPVEYYFYQEHPGDSHIYGQGFFHPKNFKLIKASGVNHLKLNTRLKQTRGASVFAAVMNRLDDLKDFEESERIAGRIAAKMVAYIQKGTPDMYGPKEGEERQTYEKGMTFYDLLPGETVGTIDTNRPNSGLETFRSGQLKAAAAGVGSGYSSIARDYNGSYAAQRQELVEQHINYGVLQDHFIMHSAKPDYRRFIDMAILGGLQVPHDINEDTLHDVDCAGTPVPWVDPLKEVKADALAVDHGFMSRSQIIRKRGGNPMTVLNQMKRDKREAERRGLVFATDAEVSENDVQDQN